MSKGKETRVENIRLESSYEVEWPRKTMSEKNKTRRHLWSEMPKEKETLSLENPTRQLCKSCGVHWGKRKDGEDTKTLMIILVCRLTSRPGLHRHTLGLATGRLVALREDLHSREPAVATLGGCWCRSLYPDAIPQSLTLHFLILSSAPCISPPPTITSSLIPLGPVYGVMFLISLFYCILFLDSAANLWPSWSLRKYSLLAFLFFI